MKRECRFIVLMFGIILLTSSCIKEKITIVGAVATFPYPFYEKIFKVYTGKTGIKILYNPIGSSGGINQIYNNTVDFGASDAFAGDDNLKKAADNNNELLYMPACIGAVAFFYNLPGISRINLTSDIIASIYLGEITQWNDDRLKKINDDAGLPAEAIIPFYRLDGSGTTHIVSSYLSKTNVKWKTIIGEGNTLKGLRGNPVKGNSGMTEEIKKTEFSIGYANLSYGSNDDLTAAYIENPYNEFIKPGLASIQAAALTEIPSDTRILLTNSNIKGSYPLSGFTWILFYKEQYYNQRSYNQSNELFNLLWWIIHDGQSFAADLLYAPLPGNVVALCENILKSITYKSKSIAQISGFNNIMDMFSY